MSIPGLGIVVAKPTTTSSIRRVTLLPLAEWRFQTAYNETCTVRLVYGTAEKDGTELAPNLIYHFSGTKSKIFTWRGCDLEIEGQTESESLAEASPNDNGSVCATTYLNLHFLLEAQRDAAARSGSHGPRVLLTGPSSSGKTTLARTLAALAIRMRREPLVVNTNPKQGMLSLPGTLSAAVYGSIMDVESEGGWGWAPSSGPSNIPVKLPLVYYYGHDSMAEDSGAWKSLASKLAGITTARMSSDAAVKSSGLIVDTPDIEEDSKDDVDFIVHAIEEFSINIVVVLGSERLGKQLTARFGSSKTSLGDPVGIVALDKSDGVVEQDAAFMQAAQEASIKEYFFGDTKRTLSPFTQMVDFDLLTIYELPGAAKPEDDDEDDHKSSLRKIEPSQALSHWTLAIMNASIKDTADRVRSATVLGYVYIADVDKERKRLKVLSPVSGRLGDRPLLWGKWPQQYLNLLG